MSSPTPGETFTYRQVEDSLAAVQCIPPNAMGAFRGRLQHFQRLGIVPSSPGRGRRVAYERADIYLWGVALEFAQFGIDPTVIKLVLDVYWSTLRPRFLTESDGPDQFLYFHPRLLGKEFPKEVQEGLDNPKGAPYSLTAHVLFDVSEIDRLGSHPLAQSTLKRFKNRYGMINLSALQREIDKALSLPLPAH